MTVSGNKVNAVVVENDGEYETVSFQPVTEKTNEAIINAVKEAGIVGLGGAGFPTHVKLSQRNRTKLIRSLLMLQNVSHTSLQIIVV